MALKTLKSSSLTPSALARHLLQTFERVARNMQFMCLLFWRFRTTIFRVYARAALYSFPSDFRDLAETTTRRAAATLNSSLAAPSFLNFTRAKNKVFIARSFDASMFAFWSQKVFQENLGRVFIPHRFWKPQIFFAHVSILSFLPAPSRNFLKNTDRW